MLEGTIGIVLAGGAGSRLHPLTAERAKPSVPFAGKYRIIDFVLSNCHHSGIRRILVLTQYKSHSLQKHLRDGWSIFNPSIGEYITPIPPQMRTGDSWYAGTADAVYQNLYLLARSGAEHVLILSGDHIYRMDYASMLQFHRDTRADVTVAMMRVPLNQASSFGVLGVDPRDQVTAFHEKPSRPRSIPGDPQHALVSMGIYVFSRELLCEVLQQDHVCPQSAHDFGKDILPRMIQTHAVFGYRFGGESGRVTTDKYWRDVGTIDAYFEANMDLLQADPPIDLYQANWPIRTAEGQSPPARTVAGLVGRKADIDNVILGAGTVVAGGTVVHSILSQNVRVHQRAEISQSILFDDVEVGEGARLNRCIIDKHVRIPPGERIGLDAYRDGQRFVVSEQGIVVVPKGYGFNSLHPASKPRRASGHDPAPANGRAALREGGAAVS